MILVVLYGKKVLTPFLITDKKFEIFVISTFISNINKITIPLVI